MTVQKAQGFLGKVDHEIVKAEDAAKIRKGPTEALELASHAKKLIAAKGKAVTRLDLGKNGAKPEDITAVMMGPTGNMRAPTFLVGDTLLVGFNEEAYQEVFGS